MTREFGSGNPSIRNYYENEDDFLRKNPQDLARLQSLMESMTPAATGESPDSVAGLKEKISRLYEFLSRNDISLSMSEEGAIDSLMKSGVSAPVMRRKLDDLLHRIRSRAVLEIEQKREEQAYNRDINSLSHPGPGIRSWILITLHALRWGILTPFSHMIRRQGIAVLLDHLPSWTTTIAGILEPILGREYYAFTIREYNALVLLLRLKDAAQQFGSLPEKESYTGSELIPAIENLARAYVPVIRNRIVIEETFAKIEKSRKLPHGTRGILMNALDRPLKGSIPMAMTEEYRTTRTVTGAMACVYTADREILVTTLNQVQHLAEAASEINDRQKELTPTARDEEKKTRDESRTDTARLTFRRDSLNRVLNDILPAAETTAEKILKGMARNAYEAWKTEHSTRPLLRIRRLVSGICQFFTEALTSEKILVPVIEEHEYQAFFTSRAELLRAAASFNALDTEISTSREKDLAGYTVTTGLSTREAVHSLISGGGVGADTGRLLRESLTLIASRSYELAVRAGEICDSYYMRRGLMEESVEDGFTFFTDAVLKNTQGLRCHLVMGPGPVTVRGFLEGLSGIAYYLARELFHPGIEGMEKERTEIQKKISGEQPGTPAEDKTAPKVIDIPDIDDLGTVYTDMVTGLWNRQYFEDQVVPRLYDQHRCYRFSTPRYVFMTSLDGLPVINKLRGHDVGDRIFREVAEQFRTRIMFPGADSSDIVLRWDSCVMVGFLNNMPRSTALDVLRGLHTGQVNLSREGLPTTLISLSSGLYADRQGVPLEEILQITRALMLMAATEGQGRIACIRNADALATVRQINTKGELPREAVTFL